MPYIGRGTDKLSNVEVLDNITFDGSSSYTLQKGGSNFTPSSANNILISIDGVVQAGNFTVSGSTIDFGTAVAGTSTCDFILHYGTGLITTPADGTVTNAKLSSGSFSNITGVGTLSSGLTLSDNILFDTASKGIYLGVTSATASNLLDDYEEGTWTPTFINFTGNLGETQPTNAEGHYTKIGNLVFISVYLNIPANGDSSALAINNIPFASKDTTYDMFGGSITRSDATITNGVGTWIPDNSTNFYATKTASATLIDYATFSGKYLQMVATYLTDA